MPATIEPITPTDSDRDFARASSEALARLIDRHDLVSLHSQETGIDEEEINLPANIARLFQSALKQMGQGQSLVILPVETELTTSQAAEIVGVSRPFFVRLLEQGDIPFHMAGAHRRVRLQDVLTYRQEKARQHALLDELVRQAQELDMGY